MELRKAFSIIRKYWMLIFVITTLSILAAGILSFFVMDEIYQSTATAIIIAPANTEDGESSLTYDDYILNTKLVNSYRVLCKTNHVLLKVIEQLDIDLSVDELSGKIIVTSQPDTEFLHIIAEDKVPARAMDIANTLATIFQEEVTHTMNRSNVKIVDYATLPTSPVRPDKGMNVMLAATAGILLGIGLSLFMEYIDVNIKSADELEELLDIPVIGTVPHMSNKKWGQQS